MTQQTMIDGKRERQPLEMTELSERAHEPRLRVNVTIRPGHMGQMLADGRLYASGVHSVLILADDLGALERLLEPDEEEVGRAVKRHERLQAAWVAEKLGRDVRAYPGSPAQAFRGEMLRDVLPITKIEVVEELESLSALAARRRSEQVQSHVPQSTLGADIVAALMKAGMIAVPAPTKVSK